MRNKMLTAGLLIALALSAVPSLGTVFAQDEETPRCDADWLAVAASAIGIEADALREALDDGQTVAEVAEANDVDPETVVDAIVEHAVACADNLPTLLARRFRSHAEAMALDLVYGGEVGPMGFGRGPIAGLMGELMPRGMFDFELEGLLPFGELKFDLMPVTPPALHREWLEAAADAIGIDVDALTEALADGQTIAEVAEANDVTLDAVIDAIVAAETERLTEQVEDFVQGSLGLFGRGMMERRMYGPLFGNRGQGRMAIELFVGGSADWLSVAAEAIGIERDALVDALADGQTVAEVAEANNVNPQAVIDAIVAAETEDLAAQVADYVESEIDPVRMGFGPMPFIDEARPFRQGQGIGPRIEIAPRVEVPGLGRFGEGMVWGFGVMGGVDSLDAAAEAIGVARDALVKALEEGQTLAEVAEANGVDPQAVIDALLERINTTIDEALKDGWLSEEMAEAMRARMADRVEAFVTEGFPMMWGGAMIDMMEMMPHMGRNQWFDGADEWRGMSGRRHR